MPRKVDKPRQTEASRDISPISMNLLNRQKVASQSVESDAVSPVHEAYTSKRIDHAPSAVSKKKKKKKKDIAIKNLKELINLLGKGEVTVRDVRNRQRCKTD